MTERWRSRSFRFEIFCLRAQLPVQSSRTQKKLSRAFAELSSDVHWVEFGRNLRPVPRHLNNFPLKRRAGDLAGPGATKWGGSSDDCWISLISPVARWQVGVAPFAAHVLPSGRFICIISPDGKKRRSKNRNTVAILDEFNEAADYWSQRNLNIFLAGKIVVKKKSSADWSNVQPMEFRCKCQWFLSKSRQSGMNEEPIEWRTASFSRIFLKNWKNLKDFVSWWRGRM